VEYRLISRRWYDDPYLGVGAPRRELQVVGSGSGDIDGDHAVCNPATARSTTAGIVGWLRPPEDIALGFGSQVAASAVTPA
jgi:hypothetical protein